MVDLANASTVSPSEVPGLAAVAEGVDVKDARVATPPEVAGIKAGKMPPVAAAGVELVRFILWIVIAAIVFLMGYLFYIDHYNADDMTRVYDQVLAQTSAGTGVDPKRIESLAARMESLRSKPERLLSNEEETAQRQVIADLQRSGIISEPQAASLKDCLAPPQISQDREKALATCDDLLAIVQKAAAAAVINIEKIKVLSDFAKDVNDRQQSFRSFWIQIAQLILLNLLFPLLTALLGYIFGTQQAQRKADS